MTYTVDILLDGKQYQSGALTPLRTPAIDEVSYATRNEGKLLDVRLSTHDPDGQIHYYLWTYEEDW